MSFVAESAIVLDVPEAEPLVGGWRARHDPIASRGIPAHITLLYPFLRPEKLELAALDTLRGVLAQARPLDLVLSEVATFPGVVWLKPEPAAPLLAADRAPASPLSRPAALRRQTPGADPASDRGTGQRPRRVRRLPRPGPGPAGSSTPRVVPGDPRRHLHQPRRTSVAPPGRVLPGCALNQPGVILRPTGPWPCRGWRSRWRRSAATPRGGPGNTAAAGRRAGRSFRPGDTPRGRCRLLPA